MPTRRQVADGIFNENGINGLSLARAGDSVAMARAGLIRPEVAGSNGRVDMGRALSFAGQQVSGQERVRIEGNTQATADILSQIGKTNYDAFYAGQIKIYANPDGVGANAFKSQVEAWERNGNVSAEEIRYVRTRAWNLGHRNGLDTREIAELTEYMDRADNGISVASTTRPAPASRPSGPEPVTDTVGGRTTSRTPENPNRRLTADEIRELEQDINRLSPRMVDAERTAIQTLIRNEKAERDGVTVAEANEIRNRANQFSTQRGSQAGSPTPRTTTTTAPTVDPAPEPVADAVTASTTTPEPSSRSETPSILPSSLSPEDYLGTDDQIGLIDFIAEQIKDQFPEMERNGTLGTWVEGMKDSGRMNRFLEQYNRDPEFRASLGGLAETMAELAEKGQDDGIGARIGEFLGVKGRAQGIIRDLIGDPENMLRRNYLDETRRKMSDLGNPFSGILQGFASLFGIQGMDQIHGIGEAIKNAFSGILGNIGAAFSEGGGGIGGLFGNLFGAGNGGGQNIGGLLASIDRSMGVAPQTPAPTAAGATASAGAGAPTPPPAPTNERPPQQTAQAQPAPGVTLNPPA